jgi:hypothetical protein
MHVLDAVENYGKINATNPQATLHIGVGRAADPGPEACAGFGSGPSRAGLALGALGVGVAGLLLVGALTVPAGSRGRSNRTAEAVDVVLVTPPLS